MPFHVEVGWMFLVSPTAPFKFAQQPTYKHRPRRQTTPAAVVIIETVATVSNVTFVDLEPWRMVLPMCH